MTLLIAAFPEVKDIGRKVARELKAQYTTINVSDFPDSEFHLRLRKSPAKKTVIIINSLTQDPDEKIIETVLAAGTAKDYKAKKVILVATYLPYMRQDTHFEKYDSFSAKHILKLFNEFDKILIVDPHLHRIRKVNELSNKASNITVNKLIANYIKKKFKGEFEFIGPDWESQQWSKKIAQMLKKKIVILKKKRFGDYKIKQGIVKFENKKYIIIDDIISTGKTIEGVIKMVKKQGAKKLIVIAIHGLLVRGADKRIRKHAELITTNTIPNKYAKIDISPAIVDALKGYK